MQAEQRQTGLLDVRVCVPLFLLEADPLAAEDGDEEEASAAPVDDDEDDQDGENEKDEVQD